MGIETHELSHGTGVILTCNTTDTAFGPILRADVDVVEQFIQWSTTDLRHLNAGDISARFEDFRAAYVCPLCPDAKPQEGEMTDDLVQCKDCEQFHCHTHTGEEWGDGDTNYGHKC